MANTLKVKPLTRENEEAIAARLRAIAGALERGCVSGDDWELEGERDTENPDEG